MPVNCAATPLTLWESNFFGHVQGAFTGATTDHKGYFETTDGGTLFLDEIGEMSIESQVKSLHVLDDNVITPVGATVGKTADIPLIAEYYLSQFGTQMRVPTPPLTPEAVAAWETYPFPGNVRELIHIIEHAVIESNGEAIQPKHLHFRSSHVGVPSSPVIQSNEPRPLNALDSVLYLADETEMGAAPFLPLNEALARYERRYLYQALEWTGGNRAEAARLLNIPQRTLYRKLANYNL